MKLINIVIYILLIVNINMKNIINCKKNFNTYYKYL